MKQLSIIASFRLVAECYSDGLGSQPNFITTTTDTVELVDGKHSSLTRWEQIIEQIKLQLEYFC
jgi:hypothetical protein